MENRKGKEKWTGGEEEGNELRGREREEFCSVVVLA